MNARVITPSEAAERIRMTPAYVRRCCESGELRAEKHGQLWRINETDFEVWRAGKTPAGGHTAVKKPKDPPPEPPEVLS